MREIGCVAQSLVASKHVCYHYILRYIGDLATGKFACLSPRAPLVIGTALNSITWASPPLGSYQESCSHSGFYPCTCWSFQENAMVVSPLL